MMEFIAPRVICAVWGIGVGVVLLAMIVLLVMIARSAVLSAERGAELWRGGGRGAAMKAFIAALGICAVLGAVFVVGFNVFLYLCGAMPKDAVLAMVAFVLAVVLAAAASAS